MKASEAFVSTLREVFRQPEVAALVVLAVLLYGIYYPAPYAHQRARDVPIALVDEEGTTLTRHLAKAIDASDGAALVARPLDIAAGQALLRDREVEALLVIPRGITRDAVRGDGPRLALWIDGVYLVRAKSVGNAVEDALLSTLADDVKPYLGRRELSLPVIGTARFNPNGGYANYIFPAVTPVILQQTMLFGVAVLLALRRQRRRSAFRGARDLAGTWLALTLISTIAALLYFGWFFAFVDLPGTAGFVMLLIIASLQGAAIAAFACAVGALFHRTETALLLLIPTSLPIFFLTGATWPRDAMPTWVSLVGSVFPATHGARALLLADQMGAPFSAAAPSLAILLILTAVYLALPLLGLRARRRGRPPLL